jgi:hypothetical protein
VDLLLFGRVFWRFKFVVFAGFLLAVALSVLTVAKIDTARGAPFLVTRTAPLYASSATLLITQSGFPWGSAVQPYTTNSGQAPVATGDLGRLTSLANLYVQIANSDIIRALVATEAPSTVAVLATQNYSISPSFYSTPLPIVTLTATSRTGALAVADAQASASGLTRYLKQQQTAARIDPSKRVVVQELQAPKHAVVVNTTKKTLPAVVFLTIMLAVIGLAFALENMRPRAGLANVARPEAEPLPDVGARRTA